jgi:hypothetical protein
MANRSDNFNRADSTTTLGTPSDGGSAWSVLGGTFGILSNEAYKVSTAAAWDIAVLEASSANVEVQATASQYGTTEPRAGVAFRVVDTNNWFAAIFYGSYVVLNKNVGGSITEVTSAFASITATDTIKAVANGNSLSVYRNGALVLGPVTDSTHNTATQHGIVAVHQDSGTTNGYKFRHDDFSITDLGGGSWFTRDRKRTYMLPRLRR